MESRLGGRLAEEERCCDRVNDCVDERADALRDGREDWREEDWALELFDRERSRCWLDWERCPAEPLDDERGTERELERDAPARLESWDHVRSDRVWCPGG